MHSLLIRSSALLTITLTAFTALMFLCFLSTLNIKPSAYVDISVGRAIVDKGDDYTLNSGYHNDLGLITIDLSSSLGHLFNWNVKQLFVYLTAEYKTADNKLNQIVLWDKIIKRGSKAELVYKKMTLKYYFWDDGHGLIGNDNVTLTLSWNVIPNVGWLTFDTGIGDHSFSFPSHYVNIK
uniref:Signal peptidase complex subunit 3 n=1 Tax=Schistosoma japonicum TaxID=6182 RepID=C1L8D6_SCHJA|nr:putative microsomal signal peptidase 22 kDa subunit [Schistosoma japonicum]